MAKEALHARIENDGTLHPPNQVIGDMMSSLREQTMALAHRTVDMCPESKELSMALTDLLDGFLPHAIAALARYQDRVMAEVTGRAEGSA